MGVAMIAQIQPVQRAFIMAEFIPGLALAERFYREVIGPLLQREFPGLRHGAALIGDGSEVLGFDTEMSTDHDWGPRALLFLDPGDFATYSDAIRQVLDRHLPDQFLGFPTDIDGDGRRRHRVRVLTISGFLHSYVGLNFDGEITAADWLTVPQQKLLALTAGAVFHDEVGVAALRARLAWYPHDVWLYLLAAGWNRISQEDHLMGRAGSVGDEVGSSLIASRLVRDAMQLCFLMERQYAPYAKWFGTAFRKLSCAPALLPLLHDVQRAPSWQEREAVLTDLYERLARMHDGLGITSTVAAPVAPFFTRPFRVLNSGAIITALRAELRDPVVMRIATTRLIGNIDQFSDSTGLREDVTRRATLMGLYDA